MRLHPHLIARAGLLAALALSGCVVVTDFGSFSGADRSDAGLARDGQIAPREDGAVLGEDGGLEDGGIDGRCDPECAPGERCIEGVCRCGAGDACAAGASCCEGECVGVGDDLANCGGCGVACEASPNSTRACTGGVCSTTCEPGFLDCDPALAGCESSASSVSSCGACGNACDSGQRCALLSGTWQCAATCPAGTVDCGGSCVDVERDVASCGGCGQACPALANATRACVAGACTYACEGTYADCDGDLASPSSNGCERIPALHYADADADGVGASASGRYCPGAAPSGHVTTAGDCDDSDATRYPGQLEGCNGRDDDCDPRADEGFSWMGLELGASCSCESGARTGVVECSTALAASCTYPAEACNGRDDDCDGTEDDGFECAAGATGSCTVTLGSCTATGTRSCDAVACEWNSCELPPETCDGVDSDCDGFVDDGALAAGPAQDLVATLSVVAEGAWHPTAGQGGAVAYYLFYPDDTRRIYWQRLSSSGALVGSPVRLAEGTGIYPQLGIGWDGEQWAVFYAETSATGTPEVFVRRVSSAGVAGSASLVGPGNGTRVAGDGSRIGVAALADASRQRAGIYSLGAWVRPMADLLTLGGDDRFTNDFDIASAGGDDFVVVTTADTGAVHMRVFDATSAQTERRLLTDPGLEYPLRAAVIGGRLGLGWREGGVEGAAGVFELATGALIRSTPIGATSNDVHVVPLGDAFLVGSSLGALRMRTDGTLYPERYALFSVSSELFETPGGSYEAMRVFGASDGAAKLQGIGCP